MTPDDTKPTDPVKVTPSSESAPLPIIKESIPSTSNDSMFDEADLVPYDWSKDSPNIPSTPTEEVAQSVEEIKTPPTIDNEYANWKLQQSFSDKFTQLKNSDPDMAEELSKEILIPMINSVKSSMGDEFTKTVSSLRGEFDKKVETLKKSTEDAKTTLESRFRTILHKDLEKMDKNALTVLNGESFANFNKKQPSPDGVGTKMDYIIRAYRSHDADILKSALLEFGKSKKRLEDTAELGSTPVASLSIDNDTDVNALTPEDHHKRMNDLIKKRNKRELTEADIKEYNTLVKYKYKPTKS